MKTIVNGKIVESGSFVLGGGPSLQSLSITTPPNKTQYIVGDTFDPTGMVGTATFSGGETVAVDETGLSFSPSGPLAVTDTAVTVSLTFGGKTVTAEQDVVVSEFLWWSPHMTSDAAPAPYSASASSVYNSGYAAWNAFDGNAETYWHVKQGESAPQWVSFDFGKNTVINGIRMYRRRVANLPTDIPYSFTVQGSYDGENWTDILNVENAPGIVDASVPREHMFGDSVYYRIYRLYNLIGNTNYRSIAEIEFSKSEVPNDT